jgi:predicted anti-sigma-YlaC factor YlaD
VRSERRCTRARETLSAVLDGEAPEADVRAAVRHVRHCVGCRDFVVGVVTTTRALRAIHVIRPSSAGQRH